MLMAMAVPAHGQVPAPTVTTDVISSITAPLNFRFSARVFSVTTTNVTVGVSGGSLITGRLRCFDGATSVSCDGPLDKVSFSASSPLITGETYELKVNPEGVTPQVNDGVNPVAAYRRLLRAPSSAEEVSPGLTQRWRRVRADAAGNGVYLTERRAGARATYRFIGTSIIWITKTGPMQGLATLYIDGTRVATIDTYSSQERYRVGKTISGLSNAAHTLVVRVEGRAGRGRGAWVAIDGFRTASGGTVNEYAALYRWLLVRDNKASGRMYATTSTPSAAADFRFKGRGLDWFTHTGPDQGIAKVYVDGKYMRTFDNYSSSARYGVRRSITNLTDAQHMFTVVVTGQKNRASRGAAIKLDAFVLRAATADFRRLGAWIDLYDYTDTSDPTSQLNEMRDHGVKTLYIQTGRHTTNAFHRPNGIGRWVEGAHARGIKVIGWYLPRYDDPISSQVTKTTAIASYRSPAGQRFDGLAIDIEDRTDPDTDAHLTPSQFFAGITKHLRLVRSAVGVSYPIGAITFAPLDMDIWPGGWNGFPWSSIARYADVAMPMSYWSNRYGRCEASPPDTRYCVDGYTRENVTRTRALTGLPVHIIGGVMTHPKIGPSTVRDFVDAAKAVRAYGASLYDARSTSDSEWVQVEGANSL